MRTTIVASTVLVLLTVSAVADGKGHVGSYSPKKAAPMQGYSYRMYRYYSPQKAAYKQHVVVYYNARPDHAYYYNPETKKYWGRCNLKTGKYSLLPASEKKSTVLNVPESAFLPPGEMPPPEAGIEEQMLPPPELAVNASAETEPRQFYTPWIDEDGRRFVCFYFFKVHPLDASYQRQMVLFYPDKNKDDHIYFFNEEKQAFWGRCLASDPEARRQSQWQLLQNTERGPTWSAPFVGDPIIPGARDREVIQKVPDPPFVR